MVIRSYLVLGFSAAIAFVHAIGITASSTASAAWDAGARFAEFVWSLGRGLVGDVSLPLEGDPSGSWSLKRVDPSVLNSLRHEAGMRPLRC